MYFHVWFVTKCRRPTLVNKVEEQVKEIFAECIQRHEYRVLELEINRGHMHLLVEVADRRELSTMVRTLKAVSAKELLITPHFRVGNVRHFWAKRYGCKEIDFSEIGGIRKYIRNQKKIPRTAVCGDHA